MKLESSVKEFIEGFVKKYCPDVTVNCYKDPKNGFMVIKPQNELKSYNFFYPSDEWDNFTLITIRHETGHIVLDEMLDWSEDGEDIRKMFYKIKNKRKWFVRFQRIWYWHKWIRWIKIKMGYSTKLWYKSHDKYRNTEYLRWEVELFADWFAVYGWKELDV